MWKIIIIEVLVFCFIGGIGGEDENGGGVIGGPLLIVSGIIAWFLRDKLQGTLYWYAIAAFIFGTFRLLSSLCPNIRDLLIGLGICGVVVYFSARYRAEHPFITTVGFVAAGVMAIGAVVGTIENIRNGVNPDEVAKEKAKERKIKFKVAKLAFKIFKGL